MGALAGALAGAGLVGSLGLRGRYVALGLCVGIVVAIVVAILDFVVSYRGCFF